jgi:hypothetical protein
MLGFLIGGGKLILLGAPHWELRFRPFPRPALHVALTTLFHVLLSLAGIFSGFVVVFGLLKARNLKGWTTIFLWTTVATSVTGFLFPVHKLLPSHILGILSLIALAIAIVALYRRNLAGGWRQTYVVSSVLALYLNVFVLVVQLFQKVPALRALAPTQSEAPFKLAQLVVLVLFVALGVFATRGFRSSAQGLL